MRVVTVIMTDWKPTPAQDPFMEDGSPLSLLCGGLGSGKTSSGAEKFVRVALGNPEGTESMMVAPTLPMFQRFMQPAFERAAGHLLEGHNRSARFYLLHGNRKVWYGTASDPASLEGANLVAFWGDEIRYWPYRSFQNLNARRRDKRATCLQGILTSTPAMGWMEEEFNRGKPGRARYRISTRDNAKNLAPGYIDDLQRTYSPRLCRSLIEGDFSVIEGQVYESFEPERHLLDWRAEPVWRTTLWVDFGVRRSSVLFAQETGDFPWPHEGRTLPPHSLIVFDELQAEELSTERLIERVRQRLVEHGLEDRLGAPCVDAVYCDPAGRARDIAQGMPSVQLLKAAFGDVRWTTDPRWTWIPTGVSLVDGALNPMRGEPTLYFDRRLLDAPVTQRSNGARGVVAGLRGYRYPDEGGDHPVKDGFFEHAMDALRYGVINSLLARGRLAPERVGIRHGGL